MAAKRESEKVSRYPGHRGRLSASERIDDLRGRLLARRRVESGTGCWIWLGQLNNKGYGRMKFGGKNRSVPRLAAHAWLGFRLESAQHVLHRCDNPPCFNPDHLWTGTHQDNVADRERKGRRQAPRGSAVATSKLTEAQVVEIIRALQRGETQTAVGERFGVSQSRVSSIARRRSWRHVLPGETIPHGLARGSRASQARLTEAEVIELRRRAATGERGSALARAFGVSPGTVSEILAGKLWTHLPTGPPPAARPLRGEEHPQARLSAREVEQIRIELAAGGRQSRLAREFGVSQTTIYRIARGKGWR